MNEYRKVNKLSNNITLEQKAFHEIKKAIIAGKYQPGTYITEATLVNDLGMSRTPIRRALMSLESSGFIKHYAHQGSMVQNIQVTMIEMINFIEFRLFLGSGSIEKAKRKQLDFPIEEMRESLTKMKLAILDGESELYFNEVNHFNNLILQPSQNDLIMETMTKLLNRFTAGSIKYFQIRKNSFLQTLAAYEELVCYLEKKEFDEAKNLYSDIKRAIINDLL
ncbi:hypothetical protein CN692_07360 [Bacillus sp. AFS002410]|nr:hypothetical protein CN692_07360 [Bacillus sp. AFS002410]